MSISSWQTDLQTSIQKYNDLLDECDLNPGPDTNPTSSLSAFPVRVPRAYLSRIDKSNINDPLLRQVLPTLDEEITKPGYQTDAVGENNKHLSPGLIKKYHGRALIIATGACAIHCRYCFRRHYPYQENLAGQDNWAKMIAEIEHDSSIFEVILSGGDPLSLSDVKLEKLIDRLSSIQHITMLRIHTRFPVVLPSRITGHLLEILSRTRLKTTLVLHVNHPNEIDKDVRHVLKRLHKSGLQLLNQAVLLKGINDDADVLVQLSEDLYLNHVLPYYLHMLDPVQGAAHFNVEENWAQVLMKNVRTRLPGYLVPRMVKEIADAPYKVPI